MSFTLISLVSFSISANSNIEKTCEEIVNERGFSSSGIKYISRDSAFHLCVNAYEKDLIFESSSTRGFPADYKASTVTGKRDVAFCPDLFHTYQLFQADDRAKESCDLEAEKRNLDPEGCIHAFSVFDVEPRYDTGNARCLARSYYYHPKMTFFKNL